MLPSATNGHSRTVYGILGMNCIGLPLFSVLTAVCKVIVSMNKRGRFLKCTPNIGRISICLDGMSSVLYRAHVV